jgi:hypothetical protein
MGAAEEAAIRLHAVAYDLDTAILARRGKSVDRTLEAIERVRVAARHPNLESFIVLISTDLALSHVHYPFPRNGRFHILEVTTLT